MKVKPILIVNIPNSYTRQIVQQLSEDIKKAITGYHIVVIQQDVPLITFEVFYEKDFNKVKYEELKELIIEKLEDDEELKDLKIKYPSPPIKVEPSRVTKSVEGTDNNEWFKYFTKLRKE